MLIVKKITHCIMKTFMNQHKEEVGNKTLTLLLLLLLNHNDHNETNTNTIL